MTDGPCFVCGADDWRELGRLAGGRLVRCPGCGLGRALDLIGPSRVEGTTDPAGPSSSQITGRLARGRIEFVSRFKAEGRLLALGAEAEPLAEAARRAGFQAEARDVPSASDKGFDLIWLAGLLERLADPVVDLSGLDRILSPGGLVLVETWTSNSPAFWAGPERWWSERAPEATAIYDESSLTGLMDRLGCPVRRLYYPSLPERLLAICTPDEFSEKSGPRRVLVQRFIALGDVILTTPIIRALKEQGPETQVWVQTAHGRVFDHNPHVSGVIDRPDFLCFDGRFELAYEYTPHFHAVAAYARQAQVNPADFGPELFVTEDERAEAADLLAELGVGDAETVIGLHAATSWPERTWPPERWDVVAWDLAVGRGVKVVVLGQAADDEVSPLPGVIDLRGRLSLRALMGVISRLDGLIGADSGLLHIAIALKTPLVGLFGCVPSAKRLPESGNFVALEADLPCADCLARRPVPSVTAQCEREAVDCMAAISAGEVITACGRVLAQAGRELPPLRSESEIEGLTHQAAASILARNSDRLELRPTPDGWPSLRVRAPGGGWRTLHSLRRPLDEAERWADGLRLEHGQRHLVLGAGLGYHLAALDRRRPEGGGWLVVEPDPDVWQLGLLAGHTRQVLGKMTWHVGDDLAALAREIDRFSGKEGFGQILIHPPSAGLHPALFRVIEERLAPLVFKSKTG
jgi:ADP-heptose:LPS heptosyltransferase